MLGGYMNLRLDYEAPDNVHRAICSIGRTEDVRFSPTGRRLAIAEYNKNRITVLEISGAASSNSNGLVITDAAQISSPQLNNPHGLDFIDDEKIVVTNREGGACIFELPERVSGAVELAPAAVILSRDLMTPGSVSVVRGPGQLEALICNNYVNKVTRHSLEPDALLSTEPAKILLNKWLDIPDGIGVSCDQQWLAVSNHNTHNVFVYRMRPSLNELSDPDCILSGIHYPHGVRFTSDNRFIFVADAGSPYIHIFEKSTVDWKGVHTPRLSFRVLDDEHFLRGRHQRAEGGPKGLDVNSAMNVLVTTCESQPIAFVDLRPILERTRPATASGEEATQSSRRVKYELYRGRAGAIATAGSRRILSWLPILHSLLQRSRRYLDRLLVSHMPFYKKR